MNFNTQSIQADDIHLSPSVYPRGSCIKNIQYTYKMTIPYFVVWNVRF